MLAALRGPGLKLARGLRRRALGSLQMRGQPLRNLSARVRATTTLKPSTPLHCKPRILRKDPSLLVRKDPSACCGVTLGVREFSNDEMHEGQTA